MDINQENNGVLSKYQQLVPIITLFGAASIAFSYAFELGFFFMVGWDFLSILTTADYIHHALIILIIMATVVSIAVWPVDVFGRTLRHKIRIYRASGNLVDSERAGKLAAVDSAIFIILIVAVVILPFMLMIRTEAVWFYFSCGLTIIIFSIKKRVNRSLLTQTFLFVFALFSSILAGLNAGYDALFWNSPIYHITSDKYLNGKKIPSSGLPIKALFT